MPRSKHRRCSCKVKHHKEHSTTPTHYPSLTATAGDSLEKVTATPPISLSLTYFSVISLWFTGTDYDREWSKQVLIPTTLLTRRYCGAPERLTGICLIPPLIIHRSLLRSSFSATVSHTSPHKVVEPDSGNCRWQRRNGSKPHDGGAWWFPAISFPLSIPFSLYLLFLSFFLFFFCGYPHTWALSCSI